MTDTTPREADQALIRRILPHRYPFLLVDRVKDIVPWQSAVGIKCISANEPQFTGHFPAEPVMPGVLIVEAMAQAAGVLGGVSMGAEDRGMSIYFMAIDKVKFRRKVVPGDVVELHVSFVRGGQKFWKFRGEARVGGDVVAEAEFAAMVERSAPASEAAT